MTMCSCRRSREFYRFPAMAKLDERDIGDQVNKIRQEVEEADEAGCLVARISSYTAPEDILLRRTQYGIELMDVIHSTETALRMEFSEEEVKQIREAVVDKNRKRGYYGEAT